MRGGVLRADESSRAVWTAAKISIAAAALSALALSAVGNPRAGAALAGGLVLGAFSGMLALYSLHAGLPFRLASLAKLSVQSVLGLGEIR